MREIKFRAWDKGRKRWVSNNATITLDGIFMPVQPNNFVLMQYTGLKDKNGTPIFESDILRFSDKWEWYRHLYAFEKTREEIEALPYALGVVTWDEKEGAWEHIGGKEDLECYLEVIGNIYQDSHLLEKSD